MGGSFQQMTRYLLTGIGLYVVDFVTFLALASGLQVHVALSQFIARATGAVVGFVAHRHYTFRESADRPAWGLAAQGGGYLVVSIVTLVLSPALIMVTMALTGGHKIAAKLMAEPVLVLIAYIGLRTVFRARQH
jgi:putative flippase GtrA